jgi:hypothetical protein
MDDPDENDDQIDPYHGQFFHKILMMKHENSLDFRFLWQRVYKYDSLLG